MGSETVVYRRAHFMARLPAGVSYTRAHYWIRPGADGPLRIGLTPFATRMLGEISEVEFTVVEGHRVGLGETIGNIEGVKALSEIYAPAEGAFVGANPILAERPRRVNLRPFTEGWLMEIDGEPDPDTVDVAGYARHLDETIDRLRTVYGDQADVLTEEPADQSEERAG